MPYPMINAAELASLRSEDHRGMPDVATVLRRTAVQTPTGGASGAWTRVVTHVVTPDVLAEYPSLVPGTTPCRLSASVLSGGGEQEAAGQVAGIMAYSLTVPAGTDITPADRIQVPDGDGVRTFEVAAGKTVASWNMSDSWTLTELQR